MSVLSDTVQLGLAHAKAELRVKVVRPLAVQVAVWGLVGLFGTFGLVFLYVLADRYLADRLEDPVGAAAIIAGANLLVVAILFLARPRRRRR
jgi:hypothetical protein